MYYRRKIILALLQLFDNRLEKIQLQKLLFLFTNAQQTPVFNFIPYKYGCYSYTANADMKIMTKYGFLSETKTCFQKADETDYLSQIKYSDIQLLQKIKNDYGKMSTKDLMKYIYINFPFYAINSEYSEKLLSEKELCEACFAEINKYKKTENETILFTIGYEGISIEEYFNRLIKNSINALIDVRNNPVSMKYGFSKKELKGFCKNLKIYYEHIPELGIPSVYRQNIITQKDRDNLFNFYQKNILSKTKESQTKILNLLKKYRRVALTCFEGDVCQCHRKYLAESIEKLPSFDYEVKHI